MSRWGGGSRSFRQDVYTFLDKPLSAANASYHFGIFVAVLIAVALGAWTDPNASDGWLASIHFYLEVFLAIFFCVEFIVRLWSVSADAKYRQAGGRFLYLLRPVALIDLVICIASLVILFVEGARISTNALDYLRFIQILRLLHIDRQTTTFHLLKRMIILSKWHILAAYYITFILCAALATLIYHVEAHGQGIHDEEYDIQANQTEPTFENLPQAWWFTVVTILTIGYGDIVPKYWVSKLLVCILGFCAYCTFVAASTQISVGLTLMMEEDNKKECKIRLRNTAASLIQNWYRYHRATHWIVGGGKDYDYFRKFCYRLYLTDERITKNRALAKKLREKIERKKSKPILHHERSIRETLMQKTQEIMIKPILEASASLEDVSKPSRRRSSSVPEDLGPHLDALQKMQIFREKRDSTELSISSSISDVERHIELKNMLEENLDDVNFRELDEHLLMKYRPLLRLFTFINFRILMRKFKRLRKADQLLTVEEEIAESENIRNIKMKQLEAIIANLVGKSSLSMLDSSRGKLPALTRLELCENKVLEMERKIDALNEAATQIVDFLSVGGPWQVQKYGNQRKISLTNATGRRRKFARQVTVAGMMRHRNDSNSGEEF